MGSDTIFALATSAGVAGVAVVRVSGPRVRDVISSFCGSLPPVRKAVLRSIIDPDTRQEIDSGLLLFFPGPASFTGEDVAEFHVHGSRAVVRELLRCLGTQPGLRPAAAGEFTERAFRNGRMDLLEVEALGDLLASDSIMQARFAQDVQRRLRDKGLEWRRRVLELRALTEAYIDFSDEDDIVQQGSIRTEGLSNGLREELARAFGTLDRGERVRSGFRVAILGAPNAGKSSLLNALARRDVAIVSNQAGTTRDIIEVHLEIGGLPVILFDTAGVRETDDAIEREGVRRALEQAQRCDLRLWLSPVDDPRAPDIGHCVEVHTKSDLIDSGTTQNDGHLMVSTRTMEGLDALFSLLEHEAQIALSSLEDIVIAHERQRNALMRAHDALTRFALLPGDALELRAEELRHGEAALEALVGRIGYEEVLGEIFSRFCIGK